MRVSKRNGVFAAKLLVTALLLATLAGVAGADLAPQLPLRTLLLYAFVGAMLLLGAALVGLIVALTFRQFILRHGGTDPQWFWFRSEPPGLVQLRKEWAAQQQGVRHQHQGSGESGG